MAGWLARGNGVQLVGMARRLRIQFPGACYHVINRGNLQHDVFATVGAKRSFLRTLDEAAQQSGWRLHAFVVMRNHYHLAVETPQPNLVDGMHWLQSTFAGRLLRFHGQHGHVFQGRYRSLLIEDDALLARVCDYVHLNPVRAGAVTRAKLQEFEFSSLWRWLNNQATAWMAPTLVLRGAGLEAVKNPWPRYLEHLREIAARGGDDDRMMRGRLSSGWAIGTLGWRRALAREHSHLALEPEMSAMEIAEVKQARWQAALSAEMRAMGRTADEVLRTPKGAAWKVDLARKLRASVAPPFAWLASSLNMGKPSSVRVYLCQTN